MTGKRDRFRRIGLALLAASMGGCVVQDILEGIGEFCGQETLTVTTTADIRRDCSGDECSLWGAVNAANFCNSGIRVQLPEDGRFTFDVAPADGGRPPLHAIFPAITGKLTVVGNNAEIVHLRTSGASPDRFFTIRPGGNLTVIDLTFRSGGGDGPDGPTNGGAFMNYGTLTLENATLLDNRSRIVGGAIDNHGTLVVRGGRYMNNRTGGCDEAGGGAINNRDIGTARIERAEFRDNQGCGGGLRNGGTLQVVDSTFDGNQGGSGDDNTYNHGGAIINELDGALMPSLVISGSTFRRNRALFGGAIAVLNGRVEIVSSTFSDNAAYLPCPSCAEAEGSPAIPASAGIGISGAELDLSDVTITGSSCDSALQRCGGGLVSYRDSARMTVSNSIVAANPGGDCVQFHSGPTTLRVTAASLDSDSSCPSFTLHGPPQLGPLADNGGTTWTHALQTGSPAVDAGTACLPRDQRGAPRAGTAADPCDIGAFEIHPPPAPMP